MTSFIAEAEADDFDYSNTSLRVGVWLDRDPGQIYNKNSNQTVGFESNEDGYAVVYRIDVEGLVTVLWPRSRFDDGFIFGAHEYQLPVSGARQMRVSTKTGEGFVEALVSRYPFDLRDLQIDFHHERNETEFEFRVAGDPLLAMNEVNFALTGLEDAADYVVSDFTNYYVHQQVDHPRYLCDQCHVDDDVNPHPYRDTCTMDIEVDYSWHNTWRDEYGYYPIYVNPVYVYVDPWTWRPWINWWYTPYYVCPPIGHYGWGYHAYCWYDSPYYGGNCGGYYNNGHRRYRPLDPGVRADGTRRKVREYARVSPLVSKTSPSADQRKAMKDRTQLAGSRTGATTRRSTGDDRLTRSKKPDFDRSQRTASRPGLQIRDGNRTQLADPSRVRHTASGTSRGSATTVQTSGAARRGDASSRFQSTKTPRQRATQNTTSVKPGESRSRGARVWNSGRSRTTGVQGSTSRTNDKPQVRTQTPRSSRNRETVKPRTSQNRASGSTSRSSGTRTRKSTTPKQTPQSTNRRSKTVNSSSSGSSGRSSNSTVKSSGSSSRSSGNSTVKSSGSSSRSSGGSRSSSSGTTRSSGGSSGRSSGGGSRSGGRR